MVKFFFLSEPTFLMTSSFSISVIETFTFNIQLTEEWDNCKSLIRVFYCKVSTHYGVL